MHYFLTAGITIAFGGGSLISFVGMQNILFAQIIAGLAIAAFLAAGVRWISQRPRRDEPRNNDFC